MAHGCAPGSPLLIDGEPAVFDGQLRSRAPRLAAPAASDGRSRWRDQGTDVLRDHALGRPGSIRPRLQPPAARVRWACSAMAAATVRSSTCNTKGLAT